VFWCILNRFSRGNFIEGMKLWDSCPLCCPWPSGCATKGLVTGNWPRCVCVCVCVCYNEAQWTGNQEDAKLEHARKKMADMVHLTASSNDCVISMNAFPWVWIQPEGHLPEMLTEPVGIQACTWVLTIELNHVARHSVPLMVPTTDADETNYTAQKYYKRLYLALNRQPNLYLQQNIKDNILNNILNNNILVTKPFWLRLTSNSWTNLFIYF